MQGRYRWATWGDLNAFFGLMLDNVTNLVLLAGLLDFGFGFPREVIYERMIPGTAFGVLVGDLIYTWMAARLAKRTGRSDVTAMPLGLDTPSTIGMALVVLGPCYLQTGDAILTWKVGMAAIVAMGLLKIVLSFFGGWIGRLVPQAGLLGSLAGVGVALLGFMPLLHIFEAPVVGLVALGVILYAVVARLPLPGRLPGVFASVLAGMVVYYVMGAFGLLDHFSVPDVSLRVDLPIPTLGFVEGMGEVVKYLPVVLPLGLLTIVGGINVAESARAAGDDYRTRDVLLAEAVATLAAGIMGGVAQSTPYIGHPAYKKMGGRAGYTLATGLFIGLGGIFGWVSWAVEVIPIVVVAPILVFLGLEIVGQAFVVPPRRHAAAVAFALLPVVADLVRIQLSSFFFDPKMANVVLTAQGLEAFTLVAALGSGFIITAMLWGATLAFLIDRRQGSAAAALFVLAGLAAFGFVHSVHPNGGVYWPWESGNALSLRFAVGYAVFGALVLLIGRITPSGAPQTSQ